MAYSKPKLKCNANEAYYSHKKNSQCCEGKSKQLSRRHKHYGTFIRTNTKSNLRLSNSLFSAKASHKISWIIHVFDYLCAFFPFLAWIIRRILDEDLSS
jgi:hypothetical protein